MAKSGSARRAMRARPRRRPGPVPVDRAERDHPDRRSSPAPFPARASASRSPQRLRAARPRARNRAHRRLRRWSSSSRPIVSLVIGEIVPKQIALRSPEPIAVVMSRPMRWLSKITAPFVWLLDRSSALIFRLLGLDRESKNQVTAEELHLVVAEAQTAGVLEEDERAMISGIVRLADRPVREVMTPRTEVDWIDVGCDRRTKSAQALLDNAAQPHPGRRRLGREYRRRHPDPRRARRGARGPSRSTSSSCAATAPVIPDLMDAMDALAVLRSADVPLALVHDEYGHLDGIVTPGQHPRRARRHLRARRRAGRGAAAGRARRRQLAGVRARRAPTCSSDRLGVNLPDDRDYSTVAGFALVGAQAPAGDRRELPPRRLVVRDRRHGRPQDRQADRLAAAQASRPRREAEAVG